MTPEVMRQAIMLSIENVRRGGGPFAAVIVKNGGVVSAGVNQVTTANDPTAHAEIVAIREGCLRLGHFELQGCEMYATCEPCPMCLGAIYWSRIDRVYYGNTRADAAVIGFDDSFIYDQLCLPVEGRSLPLIPCLREEALEAFREWERKSDRIRY